MHTGLVDVVDITWPTPSQILGCRGRANPLEHNQRSFLFLGRSYSLLLVVETAAGTFDFKLLAGQLDF